MQNNPQHDKHEHNKRASLVARVTSKRARSSFLKEVKKMRGGENILDCIQCGLCAGSCPTRFAMDYSPMQIIKMVHLGMRRKVLSSKTIWVCSTCYACATRCPRAIDLTAFLTSLRNLALQENIVANAGVKPKFHRGFFEVVNKYGRLHEPDLLRRILRKSDLPNLLHNAKLGWRLLRRGRLRIRPAKIERTKDLHRILESIIEDES